MQAHTPTTRTIVCVGRGSDRRLDRGRRPGQAPTPAKPATAAKKASIYDKSADAHAQVEKATAEAKRENKRILVMFGGDWCGWCHKLHELFASDAEIRKVLSYEYVLVMVDTEAPGAADLLGKCKAALSKEELRRESAIPS